MLTVALEQLISPVPTAEQPLPPVVQAQHFELVDATGAARAVLRMAPEGTGPEVALLDEAGQRRATMTQNSEGEYAFLIFDPNASLRFGVGTTKRGFVGLNVRDGHGVIRSNLYASDDGSDTGFRTSPAIIRGGIHALRAANRVLASDPFASMRKSHGSGLPDWVGGRLLAGASSARSHGCIAFTHGRAHGWRTYSHCCGQAIRRQCCRAHCSISGGRIKHLQGSPGLREPDCREGLELGA